MRLTGTLFDFVSAISWPALVAVVLWRLWPQVKERVGHVSSFKIGGTAVDFAQRGAADELRNALDSDDGGAIVAAEAEMNEAATPSDPPLSLTRDELERVLRSFARAGWAMGASGEFASSPEPVLEWGLGGAPSVSDWKGRKATKRQRAERPDRSRAKELEGEIVDLKAQALTAPLLRDFRGRDQAQVRIALLQEALREVDPDSPFGYD